MERNQFTPEEIPSFSDLADEFAKAPPKLRGLVLGVIVENYPNAPAALLDGSGTSDVEAENEAFCVSHEE